jgi:hypothetical protein
VIPCGCQVGLPTPSAGEFDHFFSPPHRPLNTASSTTRHLRHPSFSLNSTPSCKFFTKSTQAKTQPHATRPNNPTKQQPRQQWQQADNNH